MKQASKLTGWRPSTRLGWWSVWLSAAYVVLLVINNAILMRLPYHITWRSTVLPFYGVLMVLCGFAGGMFGVVAVIRWKERGWLVWAPVLLGVSLVFFLLGEFLLPH